VTPPCSLHQAHAYAAWVEKQVLLGREAEVSKSVPICEACRGKLEKWYGKEKG
jgi:hypothetical protein